MYFYRSEGIPAQAGLQSMQHFAEILGAHYYILGLASAHARIVHFKFFMLENCTLHFCIRSEFPFCVKSNEV